MKIWKKYVYLLKVNLSYVMINKRLLKEITEYCEYNDITDIEGEINRILKLGFSIVKYGTSPFEQMTKQDPSRQEEPKPKRTRKKKEAPQEVNLVTVEVKEIEEIPQTVEEKPKKKMRIIKNS